MVILIPTPRNLLLGLIAGALAGLSSSAFLIALEWVAQKQTGEPTLLYFLPFAGLMVGGLYDRFGDRAGYGTNLIIAEIHDPRTRTPGRMTPMIFLTTLISHLFGASVGREGTAVQMGSSLADQLARFLRISNDDRRVLLMAGAAAGFSSALGAPIAGMIFGMEVLSRGLKFRASMVVECAIASGTAYAITRVLHVPHTVYGVIPDLPIISFRYLFAALVLGLFVGLLVRSFIAMTEGLTQLAKVFSTKIAVRAFVGGFVIIALVLLFGNRDSTGLGIPAIKAALLSPSPLPLAFEKLVMTAVSLASGFRGGEFIPLLFIGATAASASSVFLSVTPAFAAACGISSAFGSAARVPLALSVFAAEHFAPSMLIYALLANATARIAVGENATIFPSQKRT